ncbi:DMT family transporter [Falsiphaeobacter marinintestinus]|uniref:DMT family transporter n=1 Tax=Falsiphaeobacter marinintestinus TaxID=1492905 RepID=UPI0011B6C0A7|nr:DMT family transporter [Phaeobacter marinintestinus]
MRQVLLIAVTMTAFAANSILNRLAVDSGAIEPGLFAVVRVAAGAAMLVLLVLIQKKHLSFSCLKRWGGAGSLALYMIGFSLAYRALDAGAGALILFGATQITMFTIACFLPSPPSGRQLTGAGIAFLGLCWVLWPGEMSAVPLSGAVLMLAAGVGWGIYSVIGRTESEALPATAANFCLALPFTAAVPLVLGEPLTASGTGLLLAVISGAITSGLGYALWYRILPTLTGGTAATVMLSVPIIALAAGAVLLGETPNSTLILGSMVVIGGIAFAVRPAKT